MFIEIFVAIYLIGSFLAWGIASALDDGRNDWSTLFVFAMSWYAIGAIIGTYINYQEENK